MKKLIIYAIALTTMLSMLAALGACGEKEPLPVSVTNVELNVSSLDLTEGDEVTLTATIAPENAANKAVSWNSSDNTVATVSNGKVMAVKAGKATITVTTEDGNKTANCEVTVSAKVYPVESVSLDKTSVELTEGDNVTLTAIVTPDNATNKNVVWSSSDETIATVDNGKVTAVKEGSVIITATTEDGSKRATCDVTVSQNPSYDPIAFADIIMKEMCVTAFDTNGDGELSYAEAAAVTDLNQMKLTDKSFKSFDEFQYFTNVKEIPNRYFEKSDLKSIVLPEGMKYIGEYVFEYCTSLISVTIPDSVTSIGTCAFRGCSDLTDVVIPNSVTSIGASAFRSCSSLANLIIPDSVTSIEYCAFGYCSSLASVAIPDSVTSIGEWVFGYCSSLTSVTIPDSVTSMGGYVFACCSSLTSVNIVGSVTSIEGYTFYECTSLTNVIMPDSVTSIGEYVFAYCSSLTSVTIPVSVTRIGALAFYECSSLTSITIPDSVTSIGDSVFYGCSSLLSVTIPDSVTSIEYFTFYNCSSLTSVTIPDSVTSIGHYAFYGCGSLTSVTIPESVTSIQEGTFYECSNLTNITIPDSVTSIEGWAFIRCYCLTSVTIPDSVTSIGELAFGGCNSLTSVTIPDSVTIIGDNAFANCVFLKNVLARGITPCTVGRGVFSSTPLEAIYVPEQSEEIYKIAEGWCEYSDIIQGCNYDVVD